MIALEPEAASIYCKHLPVEKLKGSNSISAFQPGSKYLVLDAGGNKALMEREREREREREKERERERESCFNSPRMSFSDQILPYRRSSKCSYFQHLLQNRWADIILILHKNAI